MKTAILIITSLILLGTMVICAMANKIIIRLNEVRPQLQEEFVAAQTTKLKGEVYICGTVLKNRDNESLYCRGFTDGYSWAVAQIKIDEELNK